MSINHVMSNQSEIKSGEGIKRRKRKPKLSETESIQLFWSSPLEARFGEEIVAAVRQASVKTLQGERWRGEGIPFSKVGHRVLYKKADVIAWLESFPIVNNTSQYHHGGAVA